VQAVIAAQSGSSRIRTITVLQNVSLAEAGRILCAWPNGNITSPTEITGPANRGHAHAHAVLEQQQLPAPSSGPQFPGTLASSAFGGLQAGTAAGNTTLAHNTTGTAPGAAAANQHSADANAEEAAFAPYVQLNFGFVPRLFRLPAGVQDKHLQISNLTLAQLPQQAMAPSSSSSSSRRLLQQHQQRTGVGPASAGAWTLLLWSFDRYAGRPLPVIRILFCRDTRMT